MKHSKKYKQILKQYRKSILKCAKEASKCPWESMFGLDMFVEFLKYMKDYYTLGENVFQCDECKENVIDTLTKTLSEYDAWQHCEDNYTKVLYKNDINYNKDLKHWLRLGYHLQEQTDPLFTNVVFLHKYEDFQENVKEMTKEYLEHRKNFFNLICENIETWWD